MIRFNFCVARGNFFKSTLPQVTAESLNVRLIRHGHAATSVRAGVLECGDNNSFNASTSVHFILQSDLVVSSLFKKTAGAAIRALGVLTENYEVDVVNFAVQ